MPLYLLVTNPFSSRGLTETRIARVAAEFAAAGSRIDILRTVGPGDAERNSADLRKNYAAVVVAGGDGTICEVVNGLAGRHVPVGIIPRGTGNVLAKELRLPKGIRKAIDVILKGKTMRLDVGIGGTKRFLLMASAGYDAQVTALAHKTRRGRFGYASFIVPMWRTLKKGDFPVINVDINGRVQQCRHVVIANVSSYGGPFRPAPGAIYNDGEFDVVMFTGAGRWNMVRYGFLACCMSKAPKDDIIKMRTDRVTLASDAPVPLQMDGDPAGFLPRSFHIKRDDVTILVP
jgi:YegS/Rv2252/BmrU family lipid kinase